MHTRGHVPEGKSLLGRRDALRSLAATPVALAALVERGEAAEHTLPLRLKPLYRVRFRYKENFGFKLEGIGKGAEWQYFSIIEGKATGSLRGRMIGANHPRRRVDNRFLPDLQGVIEAEDGTTVYFDHQGIAGAHPSGAWSVLTTVQHLSEAEAFRHLNSTWCVGIGDASTDDIVIDVREIVWEPLLDDANESIEPTQNE